MKTKIKREQMQKKRMEIRKKMRTKMNMEQQNRKQMQKKKMKGI